MKTKFYHFSQNNSGGSFDISETLAHHVIIEAHSAEDANNRAISVGLYFNGCQEASTAHAAETDGMSSTMMTMGQIRP